MAAILFKIKFILSTVDAQASVYIMLEDRSYQVTSSYQVQLRKLEPSLACLH